MIERPTGGQRALLVHIHLKHLHDSENDLAEFRALCLAADYEYAGELVGQRDKPCPKFFVGKGKLDELKALMASTQAEMVLFNHDLTASQERNIERAISKRVLSRTALILDIFAKRARTFEGKLQVELAQLEHQSTRLVRGWTHLERQKGGIGLRGGPGEKQIEVDRRLIRKRIVALKERLEKIENQRRQSRSQRTRQGMVTVSLVGYTKSGKSTLFNALTGAEVFVANQLFATLDPTLRALELPAFGKIVLTDTVGFIRALPHSLVDAFRATLEEICQSSFILHVVDATDPRMLDNIDQVNRVLAEIGADQIQQMLVLNKSDLLDNEDAFAGKTESNEAGLITKVWVSARQKSGLDLLLAALRGRLSVEYMNRQIALSPSQAKLRAHLFDLGVVMEESVTAEGGWVMRVNVSTAVWNQLCREWPFTIL